MPAAASSQEEIDEPTGKFLLEGDAANTHLVELPAYAI
jgi:hypothetical protein